MRTTLNLHLLGLCLLLPTACSDDTAATASGNGDSETGDGDGDGDSTSGNGDGDGDSTSGNGDGDGDSTSGNGDGDGDSTSGNGDGDGDSTSSGDDGDSSSSSGKGESSSTGGDGDGDVSYGAVAVAGGLDRIFIWKADAMADTCGVLVLVNPSNGNGGVDAPNPWGAERGWISNAADDCDAVPEQPQDAIDATSMSGMVAWEMDNMAFPCKLDVDAELNFPMGGWQPETDALVANGVPVQGC